MKVIIFFELEKKKKDFKSLLATIVLGQQTVKSKNADGADIEKTVTYLITPKIVEEARKHFDCDTLVGGEVSCNNDATSSS